MPRPGRNGQPKARPPGASQRPPRTPRPKRPKNAHFHRSGLHFEHASQKSHVISLGQFLISPTNVAIPTMPIQSLKGLHGNYVRHFWGTMPRPGRSGQPKARPPGASRRPETGPPGRQRLRLGDLRARLTRRLRPSLVHGHRSRALRSYGALRTGCGGGFAAFEAGYRRFVGVFDL